MRHILGLSIALLSTTVMAETRTVYARDGDDNRIAIVIVDIAEDRTNTIDMTDTVFADHSLSMRPFKCLDGPGKHWCHVPYPYDIQRNIADDLTDLEYDLMFVWKGSTECDINMWNGVYYQLFDEDGTPTGQLMEMDMDLLSAPPSEGELRPLRAQDLHESDPDSHWLPRLIIEDRRQRAIGRVKCRCSDASATT